MWGKEGAPAACLQLDQVLRAGCLAQSCGKPADGAMFALRRNSTGRAVKVPPRLIGPTWEGPPSPYVCTDFLGRSSIRACRGPHLLRAPFPSAQPVCGEAAPSLLPCCMPIAVHTAPDGMAALPASAHPSQLVAQLRLVICLRRVKSLPSAPCWSS